MKQSDIKVGAVYVNRGAGRTQRRVLGIGVSFQPDHRWSPVKPPETAQGVEYQQREAIRGRFWGDWSAEPKRLWLDSFAAWCGSEVKP